MAGVRGGCGRIRSQMHSQTDTLSTDPPRLIASIMAGFNTVANNLYLIIFPVLLDLLLWLGPRLRVKSLLKPVIADFDTAIASFNSSEMEEIGRATQQLWEVILERFNLFTALRTLPVGVTSLLSSQSPATNPLNHTPGWDIAAFSHLAGIWLFFVLAGIMGGSVYFNEIARSTEGRQRPFLISEVFRQYVQMLLLTLTLLILLVAIAVPVSLLLSILAMISAVVAQIGVLIIGVALLWLLLPLIFAPHGIIVQRQNAFIAMFNSLRLVRFFLPGTGVFLLVAVLISQGMDGIWSIPGEDSWMLLIGVFGHAFTSTALISASFIYYLRGTRYMESIIQKVSQQTAGQ